MLGLMEVLGRVLILRRVAAAYMAAFEAKAQMNPSVSGLHAIFADVLVGLRHADFIRMFALHSLPF